MDEQNLTTEEIETIAKLQEEKDSAEHYTERPKSHRVLAWVLIALMLAGLALYYYWIAVPQ